MRPACGGNFGHAGILDAEFFAQQGDLLVELIGLGRQANTRIGAVRRRTAGVGKRVLGQCDHLEPRGLDRFGPVLRDGQTRLLGRS